MTYDLDDFSKPIPGDVFFTQVGMPGKISIKLGQSLVGDDCRYHHTGIAVSDGIGFEARPPKARVFAINPEHEALWFRLPLGDGQRNTITNLAESQFKRGVIKYSWMAYPHIALAEKDASPEWLKNSLAKTDRRICSQLVDELLMLAGYHLFDDGRAPYAVTPGDIFYNLSMNNEVKAFRLDGKDPWSWM